MRRLVPGIPQLRANLYPKTGCDPNHNDRVRGIAQAASTAPFVPMRHNHYPAYQIQFIDAQATEPLVHTGASTGFPADAACEASVHPRPTGVNGQGPRITSSGTRQRH